jgi:hypothetical protein
MSALAEQFEELHSAHDWHVPVKQDDVGHAFDAAIKRFAAVACFLDLEFQGFEDMASDLADHLAVIDDKAGFHG